MVVLGVLALEVVVSLGVLPGTKEGLSFQSLVIIAGALVLVWLAFNPIEYGILLLPVVAVAVPISVGTGTESRLVAALLFVAFLTALWVGRKVLRREASVVRSPVTLPLVGFVLTAGLANIFAAVERPAMVYVWPSFLSAQLGGFGVLALSAGVLLVVMNGIRELRWIKLLVAVYLALGSITIVLYLALSNRDLAWYSVEGLFSLWVVALAFGQAVFNGRLPLWVRLALVALTLAWLYRRFGVEPGWLSGWMPAVLSIGIIAMLRSRLHLVLVLSAVAVFGWLNYDLLVQLYESQVIGVESKGNFDRVGLWLQSLELMYEHPLLGTGMAGYAPYYMTYYPQRAMASHSNYVDVISQTGIIGMFFFLWFLVAIFRVGLAVRKQSPTGFAAGFANGMLAGMVGSVVAMLLGDWLIPFVYTQTIAGFRYTVHSWVLLGALASMVHIGTE
ncbi:MAG: O-antigen ligase family protein [Chloroflexota bacterium]